jgi:hypothetical protein
MRRMEVLRAIEQLVVMGLAALALSLISGFFKDHDKVMKGPSFVWFARITAMLGWSAAPRFSAINRPAIFR